jgi:hypothetical protein
MNKKFLSAILFGALMVSSTGTFVSCKDYDDDIDNLQGQIDGVKTQIAELESKIKEGKYITSVTQTENGLTFTMNDGQTYNVTNGKDGAQGEPGAAGDKVVIDEATGAIIINDKETGYFAVKNTETGKVVVPTIDKDGFWCLVNEKGELEQTSFKASPISAVQDPNTKAWTLKIWNTETKAYDEIKLPTAASSLTDLMLITRANGTDTEAMPFDFKIAEYEFKYNHNNNDKAPAKKDWAGQRAIVDNGYIMAGAGQIKLQVNPTGVDAADLDLKLVNSKNGYLSNVDFVTTPYTDMEYFNKSVTRAANANGLYNLSISDKYIKATASNTEQKNYWKQFETEVGDENKAVAFAVTAGGEVRSKYEVSVSKGTCETLDHIYFVNENDQSKLVMENGILTDKTLLAKNAQASRQTDEEKIVVDTKMEAGVWYNVYANTASALYDMHLVFTNDDKTLFGIDTKEENGMVAIRLTKTPDNITKAGFLLTIQNIDKMGGYNQAQLWVGQTSTITNDVVYDPITHQLSKNSDDLSKDKNFFQIDLTKMKDALGTEGLALWNTKVKRHEVTYLKADGTPLTETDQITETFVSELKDNMEGNNDKTVLVGKTAKNMIFAVNNKKAAHSPFEIGTQYTAVITFYDALTGGEKLNSIKVPFTFTLPAITELFAIDPGFVQDNVANCYLYKDDSDKYAAGKTTATFKLSRIFSKYDTNGFTVKLNTTDKIGSTNKVSSQLAWLQSNSQASNNALVVSDNLAYLTLQGNLGSEQGYDQVLKLTIDGKFDNAWTYPSDAVFNFQVKVMSPIEKGKIVPKEGNVVTIKASDLDGYKFGNDVIIGYTYNTEVSYKVMPDISNEDKTAEWSRADIKEVTGETGNKLYFEVDNGGLATAATTENIDGKEVTVEGGLILKGYQVDHTVETTIKINVKDHWNRVKSSPVPVKITVGE